MLPFTINLVPVILSLLTGFSILLHDSRVDRVFSAVPVTGYVSSESALRGEDHIHTETKKNTISRVSVNGSPSLNSRFTDEKKYLTPKKVFHNTTFDD